MMKCIMGLAILMSCGFANAENQSDWPMFRGNPSLTGTAEGTLTNDLALLWTLKTGGAIHGSVVIQNGIGVVGSLDGKVYAFDSTSGELKWTFSTGEKEEIESTPLLLNKRVYVGGSNGILYCLGLRKGNEIWRYTCEDRILGGITYAPTKDGKGATIIMGSYDYNLHAVDAETGKGRWKYETENYINGTPAIDGRQTIFGGCDGVVHVVDLDSGLADHAILIESYMAGSAAVENKIAYIGHYGNQFIAVDLKTEKILWKYHFRDFPFFSSAAVGADYLVFGGRDKRLHAIDKKTGKQVWVLATKGRVDSSPLLVDHKIVIGSDDGRLYLVDYKTGKKLWSYELGQEIGTSPAYSDGKVYVGCEDGSVYAFVKKTDVKGK
jgi:outer membrane protein assembly factor BamB